MRQRKTQSIAQSPGAGFTLLEVLVALVLMSVFSLAAYQGLNTVLAAERQSLGEMARWRGVALAFNLMQNELRGALPASLGDSQPGFAFVPQDNGDWTLAFDHQLAAEAGGGIARVEYRFAEGALSRSEGQASTTLLVGLRGARLGFLDGAGVWLTAWPGTGTTPRALALDLDWDNGLSLRRVFATS
jgi:general secretion pathway protein J